MRKGFYKTDNLQIVSSLTDVAHCYFKQGDLENTIEYSLKALEMRSNI